VAPLLWTAFFASARLLLGDARFPYDDSSQWLIVAVARRDDGSVLMVYAQWQIDTTYQWFF